MAKYFPSTVPTSENLDQTQRFLREELEYVRESTDDIYFLAEVVVSQYQVAGYGQIGLDAVTPLANIGTAWQQLPFDVELIAEPRYVFYNLAGDGMLLGAPGVWYFFAKVSLEFLEAQAGRRLELTLWNTTDNVAIGPVFNFSIGRNTDGANLNFSIMFDVSQETVDQLIPLGLAVRSVTDTFTGVNAIGSIFGVSNQAEYKGDLLGDGREILWQ